MVAASPKKPYLRQAPELRDLFYSETSHTLHHSPSICHDATDAYCREWPAGANNINGLDDGYTGEKKEPAPSL
jgi:hypothetical protein